ncbi:MAG TPA: hypothetical protein GX726_02840 [Clostridiales bacterium]|nr:hypothetical protein [Clostridiales bacterium]
MPKPPSSRQTKTELEALVQISFNYAIMRLLALPDFTYLRLWRLPGSAHGQTLRLSDDQAGSISSVNAAPAAFST